MVLKSIYIFNVLMCEQSRFLVRICFNMSTDKLSVGVGVAHTS